MGTPNQLTEQEHNADYSLHLLECPLHIRFYLPVTLHAADKDHVHKQLWLGMLNG